MILEKSLGFKDAPPTNAPSTFSKDKILFAFSVLTDPPYNIETFLAKAAPEDFLRPPRQIPDDPKNFNNIFAVFGIIWNVFRRS